MFNGGEVEVRSVMAHNVHENVGKSQEGRTGLVLFGTLIDQYDHEASGKDPSGMGRWLVMTLRGSDGVVTRVICGYAPCKSDSRATRSSYQQQRRRLKILNNLTCPRTRFKQAFFDQLTAWLANDD